MVALTKWIILGLGLVAASLFFKEAAGSSLSQTLRSTGLSGQAVGGGIASVGAGVGQFGVRILDPFWSLADLLKKFTTVFSGETITSTTAPSIGTTGGVAAGLPNSSTQTPNDWFNPLPAAHALTPGEANKLGVDTYTRFGGTAPYTVFGQTHQLSPAAVDYYRDLGVTVYAGTGGGANPSTGGGGGSGADISSTAGSYAGGSIGASIGQNVSSIWSS